MPSNHDRLFFLLAFRGWEKSFFGRIQYGGWFPTSSIAQIQPWSASRTIPIECLQIMIVCFFCWRFGVGKSHFSVESNTVDGSPLLPLHRFNHGPRQEQFRLNAFKS